MIKYSVIFTFFNYLVPFLLYPQFLSFCAIWVILVQCVTCLQGGLVGCDVSLAVFFSLSCDLCCDPNKDACGHGADDCGIMFLGKCSADVVDCD